MAGGEGGGDPEIGEGGDGITSCGMLFVGSVIVGSDSVMVGSESDSISWVDSGSESISFVDSASELRFACYLGLECQRDGSYFHSRFFVMQLLPVKVDSAHDSFVNVSFT